MIRAQGWVFGFVVVLAVGSSAVFAEGGMESGGVPNPAAERCQRVGGLSVAWDEAKWGGSQWGVCRLADDSIIEQYTFYRSLMKGERSLAAEAFFNSHWTSYEGPIETWAAQACRYRGGEPKSYFEHLRPSVKQVLCHFRDGSVIEAWTLASGHAYYPGLAKALRAALDPKPRPSYNP